MIGASLFRSRTCGTILVVIAIYGLALLTSSTAAAADAARPSAPRHVTALAGNNTATVVFSIPSSSGSSRIIDYYIKVLPRSAADSAIRRCGSKRCVIKGLSNTSSYSFTVAAVNKFGVGPYSAPSNKISPKSSVATNVTVTFNANGGTGVMASETETNGTTAALTTNAFTYSGYSFSNWSSEASGGGTSFTDGELVRFTGSATLYAQWTPAITSATVTFVANGGTGSMAPETESYDVASALTANSFVRAGYTFSNWSNEASGSGTSFGNNAIYLFSTSVTLFAQWTANAPASFTGTTSPNWSGYVLSSTSNSAVFTYISGQWTVPTLDCSDTPNNRSATWVGTGGDNWPGGGYSGVLLQTGTEDDCVNGSQEDSGWFEIYPSTPNYQETFKDFPVNPGDVIQARIEINTNDQWTTVVEDLNTGLQGVFSVGNEWDVSTISTNTLVGTIQGTATGTSYSGADSAEWITEDPGVAISSGSYYPFANYETVTFSDLITNLSSWTLPNSDAYEIVQNGIALSVPGAVSNDGFTIAYTGP